MLIVCVSIAWTSRELTGQISDAQARMDAVVVLPRDGIVSAACRTYLERSFDELKRV